MVKQTQRHGSPMLDASCVVPGIWPNLTSKYLKIAICLPARACFFLLCEFNLKMSGLIIKHRPKNFSEFWTWRKTATHPNLEEIAGFERSMEISWNLVFSWELFGAQTEEVAFTSKLQWHPSYWDQSLEIWNKNKRKNTNTPFWTNWDCYLVKQLDIGNHHCSWESSKNWYKNCPYHSIPMFVYQIMSLDFDKYNF